MYGLQTSCLLDPSLVEQLWLVQEEYGMYVYIYNALPYNIL